MVSEFDQEFAAEAEYTKFALQVGSGPLGWCWLPRAIEFVERYGLLVEQSGNVSLDSDQERVATAILFDIDMQQLTIFLLDGSAAVLFGDGSIGVSPAPHGKLAVS